MQTRTIHKAARCLAALTLVGAFATWQPAMAGADGKRDAHVFASWGSGNAEIRFRSSTHVEFWVGVLNRQCCGWGTRANVNLYNTNGDWIGWDSCAVYGMKEWNECEFTIWPTEGYPQFAMLTICTSYNGGGNHWCHSEIDFMDVWYS